MPKVKTLRAHTKGGKVMFPGDVYSENDRVAADKVRIGLVEVFGVRAKVDNEMYAPRSYDVVVEQEEVAAPADDELRIISKTGNWYFFSDGEKALGRKAAAEKLGVEELPDVDFDDN